VSTPVVACEALQVYMTRMGQDTNPESCGCGQTANVVCVLTRDCANMSNDDGTDNPPVVEEVSELMTLDGVVMSNVAMVYLDATWNIEFTVTGGLGITSMSMDLPIPC
jgi:hypothetical protein